LFEFAFVKQANKLKQKCQKAKRRRQYPKVGSRERIGDWDSQASDEKRRAAC
jgi:hypothetical protein